MVPDRAQARDLAGGDRGDVGMVPEFLPGVDIRQMDFDHWAGDGRQGVAQGNAGVG